MTAADRAVGVLLALAAGFLAWRGMRAGGSLAGSLPWVLGGIGLVLAQVHGLRRAERQPARQLVAGADGTLWLHRAGGAPCQMTIGRATRLVGPSVFLDLGVASNPSARRLRTWLTPFDVPTQQIRRWSVLLPRCRQEADA